MRSMENWQRFARDSARPTTFLLIRSLGTVTLLLAEKLIQDEGVTIQPYWKSLFRHMREGVTGADMHISYEHHHYKWGWAA